MTTQNIPIECVIDAIPQDKREEHQMSAMGFLSTVTDVRESTDNYTFIAPISELQRAATWIALERLCCPFLDFTLRIEPAADKLAVTIGNGAEVKQLLQQELLVHLGN